MLDKFHVLSLYLGSSFVENDLNIEYFAKLLKMGGKGGVKKAEQALQVKYYIRPHDGSTTEQ